MVADVESGGFFFLAGAQAKELFHDEADGNRADDGQHHGNAHGLQLRNPERVAFDRCFESVFCASSFQGLRIDLPHLKKRNASIE